MGIKLALLSFTEPGTKPLQHGRISSSGIKGREEMGYVALIEHMFKGHGITGAWCDTMMGWGSLNQNWMEVACFIDTSWNWCMPTCFSEEEKERLFNWLHEGRVLMQVYYVNTQHVETDDVTLIENGLKALQVTDELDYIPETLLAWDGNRYLANDNNRTVLMGLIANARKEKHTAHH